MKSIFTRIVLCMLMFGGFSYQHISAQNSWNSTAIFTGTNYIASMDGTLNATSNQLTVEFWLKPQESNANYSIIGKDMFRIMTDNGNIRVQVANSTRMYSLAKLDSNTWTHVAVSINAVTDEIKVYLNGSLDNSSSNFTSAFTPTNDSLITGKSVYAPNLKGELDEVRIWKTIRTASEIQNNYRTHLSWYNYNYYDLNLIYVQTYDFDVYSPGFYLPYGGAVGLFSGSIIGTQPSKTVLHNNGVYYTGASYLESISANDPNVSLIGPMTVEAWIYPTAIGTKQTILDLNSGGSGGFKLSIESSGKINWIMNQTGTGNTVLSPNKWYHIAVVCGNPVSGSQVATFYINGKVDAAFNYSEMTANTGKLRIGASSVGADYFSGYMDEIRISNFSKTSAELFKGMHTPVNYETKPTLPRTTVAYNLDGALYSGTRTGYALKNFGCRFSYASETSAPLFHLGSGHYSVLDNFSIRNPFINIPEVGTAGYTYDTLTFGKELILDDTKFGVFIAMTHADMQEIKVELMSPFGDSITLFHQLNGKKGLTCLIDNETSNNLTGQYIDFAPRIGSENPFSKFNGKNSKGVWKIKITDLNNGNTGILASWGLNIDGVPYVNSVYSHFIEKPYTIYPNPVNAGGLLMIKGELFDRGSCNIELLNAMGQSVYTVKDFNVGKQLSITLPESIAKGVYMVRMTTGASQVLSKLIVN